jgi:hypothetical protein
VRITDTTVSEDHSVTAYTATIALPHPDSARAAAELRGALKQQLPMADFADLAVWRTLLVEGPEEFSDSHGQRWFGYWATLGEFPGATGAS